MVERQATEGDVVRAVVRLRDAMQACQTAYQKYISMTPGGEITKTGWVVAIKALGRSTLEPTAIRGQNRGCVWQGFSCTRANRKSSSTRLRRSRLSNEVANESTPFSNPICNADPFSSNPSLGEVQDAPSMLALYRRTRWKIRVGKSLFTAPDRIV